MFLHQNVFNFTFISVVSFQITIVAAYSSFKNIQPFKQITISAFITMILVSCHWYNKTSAQKSQFN